MIYSVKGKVIAIEQNLAVVECAGVGYACRASSNTLCTLKIGEEAFLYTYLAVREDAVDLFGFADTSELNCFKMLTSVSGVGAVAAIAILSTLTPQAFALCVASGDSKTLTQVPRIGKKIAERIVLELKDKIAKQEMALDNDFKMPKITSVSNCFSEAVSALVVLGYSNAEATKALEGASSDLQTNELVKLGLSRLAKF